MGFSSLISILSELYSTEADIRRIVDDIGLNHKRIDFHGSAEAIWYRVMDEADKNDLMAELLEEARQRYPRNIDLMIELSLYYRDIAIASGNIGERILVEIEHRIAGLEAELYRKNSGGILMVISSGVIVLLLSTILLMLTGIL